jgi:Tol biopolymer transport system component
VPPRVRSWTASDITPNAGMAWSPSGKHLATIRTEKPHDITVVDLEDGGRSKILTIGEEAEIRDLVVG